MSEKKDNVKQYITLPNLKVFWDNIKNLFASKEQVTSLEDRIDALENELKKLNGKTVK